MHMCAGFLMMYYVFFVESAERHKFYIFSNSFSVLEQGLLIATKDERKGDQIYSDGRRTDSGW